MEESQPRKKRGSETYAGRQRIRTEKQAKLKKERRPQFKYSFPISENTTDPVLDFVRRQSFQYTFATLPDGTGLESTEEMIAMISERTERLLAELCGGYAYHLGDICNLSRQNLEQAARPHTVEDIRKTRVLHLAMMVHLGVMREHLMDLERDIWVTMQMAHDPRVLANAPINTQRERAYRYRAECKKADKAGKPRPKPPLPAVALPNRVVAVIEGVYNQKIRWEPPRERANRTAQNVHRWGFNKNGTPKPPPKNKGKNCGQVALPRMDGATLTQREILLPQNLAPTDPNVTLRRKATGKDRVNKVKAKRDLTLPAPFDPKFKNLKYLKSE